MKFFDDDFLIGAATSSYQVEGAWNEGGRQPSIWDTFARTPGKVIDQDNGDVACDQYHRYKEDVALMKEMGFRAYRFSISWSRVISFPGGKPNEEGIQYYVDLCKELLANGIEPCVTLYHWDLPQYLQDLGGWNDREIIYRFREFAVLMFDRLSPYCRMWITLNEPFCAAYLGHLTGGHAPGIRDMKTAFNAVHHMNLAHALAVRAFREGGYEGQIGITLNSQTPRPASNSPEDLEAVKLHMNYSTDMFLDPVCSGEYPWHYIEKRGIKLPIEDGDMETLRAEVDFIGINYYQEPTVKFDPDRPSFSKVVPSWQETNNMGWPIVPAGLTRILHYFSDKSGNKPLYITENGRPCDDVLTEDGRVHDPERIRYYAAHLRACRKAIEEGVNLRGYFAWSLLDNYEWAFGYTKRFGIVRVDFETQQRYIKDSGYWFRDLNNGVLDEL